MDEAARRRAAALAGHTGDEPAARALLVDPSATVRAAALAALVRLGRADAIDVEMAMADPDATVRRRATAAAVAIRVGHHRLVELLGDLDPSVVEAAAWALGELGADAAVGDLAAVARGHRDPLCREAAVAALGAIGDPAGLPAILAATTDKPAIRRRAVIALAPFDGPDVDAALERARTDRDWQVREAAEELSSPNQRFGDELTALHEEDPE